MFKLKIILLITTILLLTFFSIMLITSREVKKAISSSVESQALNQMHLIKLNIENQYKSIIFYREYALNRYKEQLKNVTGIVLEQLDSYYEMYKKGLVSEKKAKELAAESVGKFRYGNDDYFFIYDLNCINIAHADKELVGKDLSDYQDIKGIMALQELKKIAITQGSGFKSFWYYRLVQKIPSEKLSYVAMYKNWDWFIGTGVYVDDIEKDYQDSLEKVIEELKETFSKVIIGKTGYLFLFNGKKEMLIHPTLTGQNLSDFKNPATGSYHINDLINASKNPDVPFSYLWNKPEDPKRYIYNKKSYVLYFEPLDWYICSSVYQEELDEPAKMIARRQIIICAAILFLSIIVSLFLISRVVQPLNNLTHYTNQISSGEFEILSENEIQIKKIAANLNDEVGRLAKSYAEMLASLKQHIEKLKETTAIKEKMESELRIAHDIQMEMLPHPAFLEKDEYELVAALLPAKEVGGDLFDFFAIDEKRICFLIGDVSDKGVPAALFMSKSKTVLRLLSIHNKLQQQNFSPANILEKVNLELCSDNDTCMFVTLFFALFEVDSGKITFANAGHNRPLVISRQHGITPVEKTKGRVLGLKKHASYEDKVLTLEKDDVLFLYTDGITEAMNTDDEQFGEKKLIEELSLCENKSVKEITEHILAKVEQHSAGRSRSDDITILTFKYKGNNNGNNGL